MTLEQLRIFVAVAEIEHVTRASYALDLMQSAVSKSVAAPEGETGLRLFDRVGRNIRLTATGAAFRDRARELLDHACRLETWAVASRPVHPPTALVQVGRWDKLEKYAERRLRGRATSRGQRAVRQPSNLAEQKSH